VLTGEGADEFLCGYNIFKETKIRRFWSRQPESTWRPALLRKLYAYIGDLSQADDSYLRRFFGQGLGDVDSPSYSHDIRWRNSSRCKRIFSERLRAELADVPDKPLEEKLGLPSDFTSWHPMGRAQYLEGTIFLAGYLLSSQGDRMGMAHSVEGRFPFLDHRVVEFLNGLAPSRKLPFLDEKQLLKRCTRDLLPDRVNKRPKQPYRAPIHKSFFPGGKPLEWVAEILAPAQIEASGCFNPKAAEQLVKKIQRFGSLSETDDMALAGMLSTQLVHRRFVADYCPSGPLDERDNVKIVSKTR
jgi:asparagine synthase (glutamine-hydrolysing)